MSYCPACRGHGTDVHEFPCDQAVDVRNVYTDQPLCGHCGDKARGFATINNVRVCHHETRDCYQMITVHGEVLGRPGGL